VGVSVSLTPENHRGTPNFGMPNSPTAVRRQWTPTILTVTIGTLEQATKDNQIIKVLSSLYV